MKKAGVGILPVSILRSVSTEMPAAEATSPRLAGPRACGDGTEAPTSFDLPGLQRVSDHAQIIIPV